MKRILKHLFRLLGLLIIIILIVGFCFDKKIPSSWCEGKFEGLNETIEISGIDDIKNYPYTKFSSKTTDTSYNGNKKTIDEETTFQIEKSVDKAGVFTMKVTKTTKKNTTSGSRTTEEKYTYQEKDGKYYYALNEEELTEQNQTLWTAGIFASFYSATPLNILTGRFDDFSTIKTNVTKYSQKGINIYMHGQKDNEEFVLAKVIGMKVLSGYKKTTSTYQDNVLKSTTEVNYSFKKR